MSTDGPDILNDLESAYAAKDLSRIQRLTGLPIDVITGQRVMSRKERRQWYHENKSRLKLPPWNQLGKLEKTK